MKEDAVLKLNGTALQRTMIARNMKNVKSTDFVSQNITSYAYQAIMEAHQNAITLAK